MTTAVLPLNPWLHPLNGGVSEISHNLEKMGAEIAESIRSIFWESRESIITELVVIYNEYSLPGWDGYDALPVDEGSFIGARQLINAIPDGVLSPELAPDTDGGISLDWRIGDEKLMSISVKGDSLVYAAILGKDEKIHGKVRLASDKCPQIIDTILTTHFVR